MEDPVAPHDGFGRGRDHESTLGILHGEAVRIERRGRLGQTREEGGLGDRQLGEVLDAEVDLRGRRDAVGVVPVEDLVEVSADDPLLAELTWILVGQAQCLDDLLGLAQVAVRAGRHDLLGKQPRAHELLGDGRGTTLARA